MFQLNDNPQKTKLIQMEKLDLKNTQTLNTNELLNTFGGTPSGDTSVFYDITWALSCAIHKIYDGLLAMNDPNYESGNDSAWIYRP